MSALTDNKLLCYFRYVDDTYAIFENEEACQHFYVSLNSLHPSLKFTTERETGGKLPFLDVLVVWSDNGLLTQVYRKPTFTGQYIRWDSFSPKKYKINLIFNLGHRALVICLPRYLDSEIARLKDLFRQNGYPDHVANRCIDKKLSTWSSEKVFGPKNCPVYIRLPYIGDVSYKFEGQIRKAIDRCHSTVDFRAIFEPHRMLPKVQKDVVPAINLSNIVYEFTFECDAHYVGRTSQRLVDRMRQHIPLAIRKGTDRCNDRCQPKRKCKANQPKPESDFAIGTHLLNSVECGNSYNKDCFRILSRAGSAFHLKVLEAVFIKLRNPSLCRQKEFVFALQLF